MRHVWCIFRVNLKQLPTLKQDIISKGYTNIRVSVPKLRIFKKRSKGKDVYEDIPLLFNYGFIRLSTEQAYSRYFLRKLKSDVPGILSWVNSLDTMHTRKKKRRVDGEEFDDFSIVATVPDDEVKRLRRVSRQNRVYHPDEIANIKIGDYITLRKYPFEGLEAEVADVILSSKTIKVKIYPQNGEMVVCVPFESVIHTIYQDYDEDNLLSNKNNQQYNEGV